MYRLITIYALGFQEEEYTGTSIVTTAGSAFEDLVQEIANYMLQNDLPAYQNSLDNFGKWIDFVVGQSVCDLVRAF